MKDGDGPPLQQLAGLIVQGAHQTPHRSPEALLAEALCELSACLEATVIWRSLSASGPAPCSGATCKNDGQPARPVKTDRIGALSWLPSLRYTQPDTLHQRIECDASVRVGMGVQRTDGIDEVHFRLRGAIAGGLREELTSQTPPLNHLYRVISALKGAHVSRERLALRAQANRLFDDPSKTLTEALNETTQLLDRIQVELVHPWHRADLLQLAEALAEWAADQVLQPEPIGASARAAVRRLASSLERLRRAGPDADAGLGQGAMRLSERLGFFEQMIQAPLLLFPRPPDWEPEPEPLPLARMWSEMHALARAIEQTGRASSLDDETWARATEVTRSTLPRIMSAHLRAGDDPAMVRGWMQMWFALELLWPPGNRPQAPDRLTPTTRLASERWRFRADLAYLLQERLRHRRDRQPMALTIALRTLVLNHARLEVGLPRSLGLHQILSEVVEGPSLHADVTGEHLRHLLDVYVGVQFLCSLQMPDGHSLAETLSQTAGPPARLRAAVSLAALFHDVGMALFPSGSISVDGLCGSTPTLRSVMGGVRGQLAEAGRCLIDRCMSDLQELLQLNTDESFSRWLSNQHHHGQPDPGLLSAWVLLQLRENHTELPIEAMTAASRAILLQAASNHPIDPDEDPAAALLILCDELFDWTPSQRVGGVTATAVRSRAARLTLEGLRADVDADGRLRLTLSIADPNEWPRLRVVLRPRVWGGDPAFCTWLTMAENLGRVQRGSTGWAPRIELSAPIAPRLACGAGSEYALLDRTLHRSRLPLRGWLMEWLSTQETAIEGEVERFWIVSGSGPLAPGSIRAVQDQLVCEAKEILVELERESGH
ncbi:MAG: hypothetical protein AAFV53_09505 [Myxococcota bacterium]